jgi:hypothetical protein
LKFGITIYLLVKAKTNNMEYSGAYIVQLPNWYSIIAGMANVIDTKTLMAYENSDTFLLMKSRSIRTNSITNPTFIVVGENESTKLLAVKSGATKLKYS